MEILNASEVESLYANLGALGFVQLETCFRNGRQRGLNRYRSFDALIYLALFFSTIDTQLEKDDLILNLGDCDDILRVID